MSLKKGTSIQTFLSRVSNVCTQKVLEKTHNVWKSLLKCLILQHLLHFLIKDTWIFTPKIITFYVIRTLNGLSDLKWPQTESTTTILTLSGLKFQMRHFWSFSDIVRGGDIAIKRCIIAREVPRAIKKAFQISSFI